MKSMKLIVCIFFIATSVHARHDCLDNDLNKLTESCYCYCPCGTKDHTILWNAQGKCIICGHCRVPKNSDLITRKKPAPCRTVTPSMNIKKLATFKARK